MRAKAIIYGVACSIILTGPGFSQTRRAAPAGSAVASTTNSRCSALELSIKRVVQDMGETRAEGVVDNSAPRAAVRASEIAASQLEIQSYIALMSANHCSPYNGPLSPETYLLPAMKCRNDRMSATSKGQSDSQPASCERSSWVIEH